MILKLEDILEAYQFSKEDSQLIQMTLSQKLRTLKGFNFQTDSISIQHLYYGLLEITALRLPFTLNLIQSDSERSLPRKIIEKNLDQDFAPNERVNAISNSILRHFLPPNENSLEHFSPKDLQFVSNLVSTIERLRSSIFGVDEIQIQPFVNEKDEGLYLVKNPRRLIVFDLDNTLICAAYKEHLYHELLFSYSSILRVYSRPHVSVFILLFALLGEVVVSTTAKRKYALMVGKHLSIPYSVLKSRGSCRIENGEYQKKIDLIWSEMFDEIWIIDDSPYVWRGLNDKVRVLKVGEFIL